MFLTQSGADAAAADCVASTVAGTGVILIPGAGSGLFFRQDSTAASGLQMDVSMSHSVDSHLVWGIPQVEQRPAW